MHNHFVKWVSLKLEKELAHFYVWINWVILEKTGVVMWKKFMVSWWIGG